MTAFLSRLAVRPAARASAWLFATAAVALLAPQIFSSGYNQLILEFAMVYVIAATGLNVAIGFSGQFQMAQPALMAIGAYTSAILVVDHQMPFGLAALLAIAVTLLFGLVVALVSLRTRSHYLLLATFGLQSIAVDVLSKLDVTGGVRGMTAPLGIPLGNTILQGATTGYSIVVIVVAGLGLAVASWIKRSYLGLGLFANRQNERLVLSAGLSPGRYRFLAVMISAFYGAVAGILVGPILTILVPSSFGISLTLLLLLIVVVGGMGSVLGVAVAAVLLTIVAQVAQSSSPAWPLIYGLTVMVVLVVAPSGLGGAVKALLKWLRRRGDSDDEVVSRAPVSDEAPAPAAGDVVTAGQDVLELRGVKRHYGGVRAVDGVSLTVRAGTVHGLIGPNGSGKTTLFDAISGFVRLTDGTIVALEHDTKRMGAAQRARAGMGRTFQLPNILPDNTVLENVVLGMLAGMPAHQRLRQMGTGRSSAWELQAMAALEYVGLGHLAHRVVRDLPYGHQRLVDLARVLVARPPIVLLDEPGAGISAQDREVVRRIVLEHRARGGTAVIVEHDMRLIMAICDRITVLRMGQVIADGTPAEVARDPTVIAAYLGDTTGEAHVAS